MTQTPDPHCQAGTPVSLEVWITLDHTLDHEAAPVWATIMNTLVSDSQWGSGDLQVPSTVFYRVLTPTEGQG